MYCGDLLRKLKKLNSNLGVFVKDNSSHFPGVYFIDPFEGYMVIGAINRNYIPEYSTYDNSGHLIDAGWRRIITMIASYRTLDGKAITTKDKIKREFGDGFFESRKCNEFANIDARDSVKKIIDEKKQYNLDRKGTEALSKDDFLEAHEALDKKTPDTIKEKREEETFYYKRNPEQYVKNNLDHLEKVKTQWTTDQI